ncbi:uncharacterized protein LOC142340680 [Convolutriloba macropyga]|uniref:uncharacterized protein LOC142340680 n=1 Tax=Convolutriloba macropyga TaxID=536237 RepID=UPI003F520C45
MSASKPPTEENTQMWSEAVKEPNVITKSKQTYFISGTEPPIGKSQSTRITKKLKIRIICGAIGVAAVLVLTIAAAVSFIIAQSYSSSNQRTAAADTVYWPDTLLATEQRGCRNSSENMDLSFQLLGSTLGETSGQGQVTTGVCVYTADKDDDTGHYYMVEWGDGVTSSTDISRDHGNRIVEVYTNEMIYRVYDIRQNNTQYCLIEEVDQVVNDNISIVAEGRMRELNELITLLKSFQNPELLRNRISYLVDEYFGTNDTQQPSFTEDEMSSEGVAEESSAGNETEIEHSGNQQGIEAILYQQWIDQAQETFDNYGHYFSQYNEDQFLANFVNNKVQEYNDAQLANLPPKIWRNYSFEVEVSAKVYNIIEEITLAEDFHQLKNNHIDEVCTNASTFYFIEVQNATLFPDNCQMSYSFYYLDKIDNQNMTSTRQKREIFTSQRVKRTASSVSENSDFKTHRNLVLFEETLHELLSNDTAISELALEVKQIMEKPTVIHLNKLALSLVFQAEQDFGAAFYDVKFC